MASVSGQWWCAYVAASLPVIQLRVTPKSTSTTLYIIHLCIKHTEKVPDNQEVIVTPHLKETPAVTQKVH